MPHFIKSIWDKIKDSKEAANAGWLVAGKISYMLLAFVLSILTARFLKPDNYGLLDYAKAYVTLFTAFCTLGINSVIIKDFVDYPDEIGKTIGTTLFMRAISSLLSNMVIIMIVSLVDRGEKETIIVTALCSVALVFQIFDIFNYWFQARYESKVTAIATFAAYVVASVYQIIILIVGANVRWFAFATSVDYICLAVFLVAAYKKHDGPALSVSLQKGKQLLKSSYHYILSGMMVAIYAQTDRLMLKQMLGEATVGYYSAASTLNNAWGAVLSAIITAVYPTIIMLHKKSQSAFERKNRQLYAIVIYTSLAVAIVLAVFGKFIIKILYGEAYLPAAAPLSIITWYTAFSYLGVARDAWIVCEEKQKYLKYIYAAAAAMNIVLNYFMIPKWGASGAALASLITQIATSVVLPGFIKDLRPNVKLMGEALILRGIK